MAQLDAVTWQAVSISHSGYVLNYYIKQNIATSAF